jgi:hypothetical protein
MLRNCFTITSKCSTVPDVMRFYSILCFILRLMCLNRNNPQNMASRKVCWFCVYKVHHKISQHPMANHHVLYINMGGEIHVNNLMYGYINMAIT